MDRSVASEDPVVTIGVPAYQNSATILRTIDSIKAQDFQGYKVLLSDDCSNDETFDICERAASEDSRFEAIRQPSNKGFLHFGDLLARAQTPYFVWLAGDDWWDTSFLSRTLAALEAHPEARFGPAEMSDRRGLQRNLPGDLQFSWFVVAESGTVSERTQWYPNVWPIPHAALAARFPPTGYERV